MFIINSHKKEIMIYTNVKTLPSLGLKRIIVFGHEMCQFFLPFCIQNLSNRNLDKSKRTRELKPRSLSKKLLSEQLLLIYRLIHFMSV